MCDDTQNNQVLVSWFGFVRCPLVNSCKGRNQPTTKKYIYND